MRRRFAILLIVVGLLGVLAFDAAVKGGVFVRIQPHFAGSCAALALPGSSEDIQIDRVAGLAYLSVLDRRAVLTGRDVQGTILKVDLNAASLGTVAALSGAPAGFRPHGLSLYSGDDGSQRLFVISHAAGQPHAIEIFERAADGLFNHIETIHNPLLVNPNAIVAVGPRQFYVANYSGRPPGIPRFIEMFFRRALSEIVYFDGDVMRAVDEPIALGTGIAASADRGRIYLSEAGARRLRVYARDSETGDLTLVERVDIRSVGDNVNVAEDGGIWIAAHPKPYQLLKHVQDPALKAPTQVLRVAADPQTEDRVIEVYLNAGEEISAGTVAAVLGQRLLIGSLTDHKILVCQLP